MVRVGILSAAHVHTPSYARVLQGRPDAELVGVFDHEKERGQQFSQRWNVRQLELEEFLTVVDAVIVCSENTKHAESIELAANQGKAVLCEKPLATSQNQIDRIRKVVSDTGITFMTAFPCPFSPTFQRLQQRVAAGDIGKVLAVNSTNRGTCPFGWFVEQELSGGGAMIDHVVHVTDLLRRLLESEPRSVTAQIGNNMYGNHWDDTAHLTLDFASGVFATIDSSWSRPTNYKLWGDVTLKVVGEKGVIEADLFGQGISAWSEKFRTSGTGSDLDGAMVDEFLRAITTKTQPSVTLEDGLAASAVAIAAYASAAKASTVAVA